LDVRGTAAVAEKACSSCVSGKDVVEGIFVYFGFQLACDVIIEALNLFKQIRSWLNLRQRYFPIHHRFFSFLLPRSQILLMFSPGQNLLLP